MREKLIYLTSIVLVLSLVSMTNAAEGLLGEYYRGSAGNPWQELILERIDPTVNFNCIPSETRTCCDAPWARRFPR